MGALHMALLSSVLLGRFRLLLWRHAQKGRLRLRRTSLDCILGAAPVVPVSPNIEGLGCICRPAAACGCCYQAPLFAA